MTCQMDTSSGFFNSAILQSVSPEVTRCSSFIGVFEKLYDTNAKLSKIESEAVFSLISFAYLLVLNFIPKLFIDFFHHLSAYELFFYQNFKHSPQGLCRSPQQLITEVNAETKSSPIFIILNRPTGIFNFPDTALGVSSLRDASLEFCTTHTYLTSQLWFPTSQ